MVFFWFAPSGNMFLNQSLFREMAGVSITEEKMNKQKTPDHVMNARAPRSCKLLPAI